MFSFLCVSYFLTGAGLPCLVTKHEQIDKPTGGFQSGAVGKGGEAVRMDWLPLDPRALT